MAHDNLKVSEKQIQQAEKVMPMWKIVLIQFVEHRMAVLGVAVILFYILVALFAPLIQTVTGLDPEAQNPLARYEKMGTTTSLSPTAKEEILQSFRDKYPEDSMAIQAELEQQSFLSAATPETALKDLPTKSQEEIRLALQKLSDKITVPSKNALQTAANKFETYHVFGTDELGRDVLIRLVYGTRVSMGVGILVALSATIIGLLIGAFAGYYGGWVDMSLMRITDSLLSLPILPILIVIAAIDLGKIPGVKSVLDPTNESLVKLVTILVSFSWMTVARLVRAAVLSLREREFILATKTLGGSDSTIIFKHLFPNVIAPLLVSVTLGIGSAIISEATLSFLGLGIQPPTPSWGNMLFNALELVQEAPFLAILPGLQILMVVVSFNYIGDGLQDAIDPKAVRR